VLLLKIIYDSNLTELSIVVLDSMLIRYSNPFEEVQRVCPRITSLDLSRNILSSLSTIAEICQPLHELRSLRLTGNRFSNIELEGELCDSFKHIEWLALNMCALHWNEVLLLLFEELTEDREHLAVV
jgi:tubulin-specific chaperone E